MMRSCRRLARQERCHQAADGCNGHHLNICHKSAQRGELTRRLQQASNAQLCAACAAYRAFTTVSALSSDGTAPVRRMLVSDLPQAHVAGVRPGAQMSHNTNTRKHSDSESQT